MADQIKDKSIFYVNSGNQLSATSNTFSTTLSYLPADNDYDSITTLQVSIPVTYWLIQHGEGNFILKEDSTSVTINVPPANYNQQSFATVLSALLTSNSPNGLTYTMTFNDPFTQGQDGLYTYTVNSSTHTISFIFDPKNVLNEQFGFDIGTTQTFTNGSGKATLTSLNVCQFVPENAVYIHSNMVSEGTDILQDVYNQNSPPFGYIGWINPCPLSYSKKYTGGSGKNATFSITDQNGLPLYLNGANVSITFMVYKANSFYEKALAFMRHILIDMSSKFLSPFSASSNSA